MADDRDRHRLGGAVLYFGGAESGGPFAEKGGIRRR